MSDCHPPLSAHHSSPTTPHQEPHIRTLAKELEDAEFRTPDGPRGNDPDPRDPDDPDDDGDDDNASDPSIKDNPILALTHAITLLSCATRHRPKDSGAACTKVCEPNTFNSTDLKKLHEFLIQCELNFHDRLQAGITLTWFKPDFLDDTPGTDPAWVDDYSEFVIEFTTNFSPHNPVSNAEHQLDNLLMKDSSCINKYILKFNCLATQVCGYGEGKPPSLVDLHTMAQGIDVCYWECKFEITHQNKSNPQPSSSSKKSSSGGSSSKQSNTSSGTSSLTSTGKGKNPQCPSSSTPKSSDSSAPDLSGIIGKDGKLTATECLCRCHIHDFLALSDPSPSHLGSPSGLSAPLSQCSKG
ncbi:hypothetical protein ID866_11799 [Astraeus odoratus]|nr:hypothetical protein ID866_11799 [Astraeus odoratus]